VKTLCLFTQALVNQELSAFPLGELRDAYRNRVLEIQNYQRGVLRLETLLENLHRHYQRVLPVTVILLANSLSSRHGLHHPNEGG